MQSTEYKTPKTIISNIVALMISGRHFLRVGNICKRLCSSGSCAGCCYPQNPAKARKSPPPPPYFSTSPNQDMKIRPWCSYYINCMIAGILTNHQLITGYILSGKLCHICCRKISAHGSLSVSTKAWLQHEMTILMI